jgi:metallo-beta-lactamase family protein
MSYDKTPLPVFGSQNATEENGNNEAIPNKKLQSPLLYKPHGACGTVTGSVHFIHHTLSGKYFAIDCGLLQGEGESCDNEVNQLPVKPEDLHAIFLTHAHIDHVGNLLQWLRAGFRGKIYCTEITAELTKISLTDSLRHTVRREDDELDKMLELLPELFICPDIDSKAKYGHLYTIDGAPGLRYAFTPTSHLIGCVAIRFLTSGYGQTQTDIVFSGDIGPVIDAESHGGLAPTRQYPTTTSGVVVLESTYGDRDPRDLSTLQAEGRLKALAKVVSDCVKSGPNARLIIPAFSLGRTTDLLADLYLVLTEFRELTGIDKSKKPVINIDSRLAKDYALELRDAYSKQKGTGRYSWLNENSKIYKLGGLPLLRRLLSTDSEPCQQHTPTTGNLVVNWGPVRKGHDITIVIAGSGTTLHGKVCDEILKNAKNPQATVLVCGYCPEDSSGARLREILNEKDLVKRANMKPLRVPKLNRELRTTQQIEVAADALKINLVDLSQYYSGHAEADSIQQYVVNMNKPDNLALTLILVHGSDRARSKFSTKLEKILNGGAVHCPTAKHPWFDVHKKNWLFADLGELRSSIAIEVFDNSREGPSLKSVTKSVIYCLCRRFELSEPKIVEKNNQIKFLIKEPRKKFNHKVLVRKIRKFDFCIEVDSSIGVCQTNDEFMLRCFPWESVSRTLNNQFELGYQPTASNEEVMALKKLIDDPSRDYPLLIVTKQGVDNDSAKFLAKSIMLQVGPVFLITREGRTRSREQGLAISPGEGLFYDEHPGTKPVAFSLINLLDKTPQIIECLNRLEDRQRENIPQPKIFQASQGLIQPTKIERRKINMGKGVPNGPSTNGNPSGTGRGNNPPGGGKR